MQRSDLRKDVASPDADAPLTSEQLMALQRACAPVGLLTFPPTHIIRALRLHGYVEIVLGGVQITPSGLERLLRERARGRAVQPG